jgi:hypothetical protein
MPWRTRSTASPTSTRSSVKPSNTPRLLPTGSRSQSDCHHERRLGGVPERLNGAVLKTADPGPPDPWVRIPPPPPTPRAHTPRRGVSMHSRVWPAPTSANSIVAWRWRQRLLAIWRAWADDLRGARIDSGHHMAEEAPDELAAALRAFLSGS